MAPGLPGQRIVVVGAGPVGALAALNAAHRGDQVDIYELRGDLRHDSTIPLNFTRSINLALSERGIHALRQSNSQDLVDNVLSETIPMFGRMIHGKDSSGKLREKSQKYDIHGRAIHAVDRRGLNVHLLNALEQLPNVRFFFSHKLTGADFKRKRAWFEDRSKFTGDGHNARAPEIEVDFDFMIGADGAHSAARFHLMKYARVSYQQQYIDTLWCEFRIGPRKGEFAISPNHLHIWPGQEFMFIAIPSLDRSFTCTLFAPQRTFDQLSAKTASLPEFFEKHFPGVCPEQISPDDLMQQFRTNPHLPLINIKCSPYHFASSVVILGDAAHAMVPFYGQGMNAGLEDVRVLFEILDNCGVYSSQTSGEAEHARGVALQRYTEFRAPDAFTINELALRNYVEMRSGVVSPVYLVRKFVEEIISAYFPSSHWATQYSRVSFGNERYSQVVVAVRRQGQILLIGISIAMLVALMAVTMLWTRSPARFSQIPEHDSFASTQDRMGV